MAAALSLPIQKSLYWVLLIAILQVTEIDATTEKSNVESSTRDYVNQLNENHQNAVTKIVDANWEYVLRKSTQNLDNKLAASAELDKMLQDIKMELAKLSYTNFKDKELKRKIDLYMKRGDLLPLEKMSELRAIMERMKKFYNDVRVCHYQCHSKCRITEKQLVDIFETSRDPKELEWYWTQWYSKTGMLNRTDYFNYVKLQNEASILNGFMSTADEWIDEYAENFEYQIDEAMQKFMPFYKQLHAYVRYRLNQKYGDEVVSKTGLIPMHLLGNLWAQTWENVYSFTKPYEEENSVDVTDKMIEQNFTPIKMYERAEQAFKALGMPSLPQTFWNNSFFEKPFDNYPCPEHAQCAWDFHRKDDVRVLQCTKVNHAEFMKIYHRLGHIYYALLYSHQPVIFQSYAGKGFQESVPDLFKLVASAPKHLQNQRLLEGFQLNKNTEINQLYRSALFKIAFLPFAYSIDKYRFHIFRDEINPQKLNCKFWKIRSEYSGVKPPVPRNEAYLDAAAKYHFPAGVEYLRYLTGQIFMFQFHESACKLAGEYVENDSEKTLYNCDIFANENAGQKIKDMLSLGASKPWPDALEALTGQKQMDISSMINYYKPLFDWLKTEIERLEIPTDWDASEDCSNL